jgi:hypothetical protein
MTCTPEPTMNNRISTQLSAFGLAAMVTLLLMGGIHQLATGPAPTDMMAEVMVEGPAGG